MARIYARIEVDTGAHMTDGDEIDRSLTLTPDVFGRFDMAAAEIRIMKMVRNTLAIASEFPDNSSLGVASTPTKKAIRKRKKAQK